eukprot:1158414-Pelagomonas_calceolata.AAC.6
MEVKKGIRTPSRGSRTSQKGQCLCARLFGESFLEPLMGARIMYHKEVDKGIGHCDAEQPQDLHESRQNMARVLQAHIKANVPILLENLEQARWCTCAADRLGRGIGRGSKAGKLKGWSASALRERAHSKHSQLDFGCVHLMRPGGLK